jgi:Wings apart-like protein regulation of heterochromatin
MEVSRRRLNTYGKATRKILVHDLFDISKRHGSIHEAAQAPAIDSLLRTRTSTPLSELSEDIETSAQLHHELQATFNRSRQSSASASVRSCNQTPEEGQSPAVFDLVSSEDEIAESRKFRKPYKRRKMDSVNNTLVRRVRLERSTSTQRSHNPESPPHSGTAGVLNRNKVVENKSLAVPGKLTTKPTRRAVNNRPLPRTENPMDPDSDSPDFASSANPQSPTTPLHLGSPLSEESSDTMASRRSTPKRKRDCADDLLNDLSSPSQLELSSLRLTPGRGRRGRPRSIEFELSDSSLASPSSSRRRMVDRLDSPRKESKPRNDNLKEASPHPAKVRKTLPDRIAPSLQSQGSGSSRTALESRSQREGGVGTGSLAAKVRTYGKQRSHLKDMVSDQDLSSQVSSQSSLQQLVSQVDAMVAKGTTFEIESEDEEAGAKVRSIHELRQAGSTNRFDQELEILLEDIESGNKALRIQALMRLVRKLQEQAFKRLLVGSGRLHRLTSVSRPDLDLVTTSIMLLAFWSLVVFPTATAQALSQVYSGILSLPVTILSETRSIFRIARDRNENLSKALVRDVAELESHVVDQSVSGDRQISKNIIISKIALKSLEYGVKRLIELAERVPEPSAQFVEAVVATVGEHVRKVISNEGTIEHAESIRLLIVWLEMTAATSKDVAYAMNNSQLSKTSQTLAEVMKWARFETPAIVQSCTRSIVELTNANAAACEQFAQTEIIQQLFIVVEDHFSRLSKGKNALDGDQPALDSVILALGCLLNLADLSQHARSRTLEQKDGGEKQVDALLRFFTQHVEETEEVRQTRPRVFHSNIH